MPLQFAAPGSLGRGRKPQEVPPPSGALMTPATNEMPGLMQTAGDNLHLQGTPARPGFSAQVQPLARPVDPGDLEAAGSVGDPYKLGAMASRAEVRTQALDTPQQMMQRAEQMGSNRSNQQLQTEMHGAGSLAQAVAAPQLAQQALGQQRLMNQQVAQATGRDQTGALADAQAHEFSARYRQGVMDERQLATIDNLAARMASGGTAFAIGG